jgi:MYXO-CTERM domain-containing protein
MTFHSSVPGWRAARGWAAASNEGAARLLFALGLVGGLLSVREARAATIDAASCALADVQAAVASASDGDTVAVPAGSCTWSSTLEVGVGRAISIVGAGGDATVIANGVGTLIIWSGTAAKPFRLSGMRFDSLDDQTPIVALVGPISAARIDHCLFSKGDTAIGTNALGDPYKGAGPVYGVVDHCAFYNMVRPYFAMDIRAGESSSGETAWTEGIFPGTDRMMYFEDDQFIWNAELTAPNAQGALYGQYGGKAAFRHDTFTGFCTYVDAHGDNPDQGTIYYEIYDNTFTEDDALCIQGDIAWQRGGQWMIHDNTFVGPSLPIRMSVYWTTDAVAHRVRNTYIWGNTKNGDPDQASLAAVTDSGQTPAGYSAANIRLDQEYFLHAPESGQTYFPYTPLAYPHPLVAAGSGGGGNGGAGAAGGVGGTSSAGAGGSGAAAPSPADGGAPDDGGGCGCRSVGSPQARPTALLALAAGALLRRRRMGSKRLASPQAATRSASRCGT